MEHCPTKLNTSGQLYPESMSDMKSRFWQFNNQSLPISEVMCPQPRRAARVSCVIDSVNRFGPRPKGSLPMYRGDSGLEILDIILSQDDPEPDLEGESPSSFFCASSPPVRTNNPIVHDAQFAQQPQLAASPLANYFGVEPRAERSPSCGSSFGGSPQVRIEGFACGKPESHCAVPALA